MKNIKSLLGITQTINKICLTLLFCLFFDNCKEELRHGWILGSDIDNPIWEFRMNGYMHSVELMDKTTPYDLRKIKVVIDSKSDLDTNSDLLGLYINGQCAYFGKYTQDFEAIYYKNDSNSNYIELIFYKTLYNHYFMLEWEAKIASHYLLDKAKEIHIRTPYKLLKSDEFQELEYYITDTTNSPQPVDTITDVYIPLQFNFYNHKKNTYIDIITTLGKLQPLFPNEKYHSLLAFSDFTTKPYLKYDKYNTININSLFINLRKPIYIAVDKDTPYVISNMIAAQIYDSTKKLYGLKLASYKLNGKKYDTNIIIIHKDSTLR